MHRARIFHFTASAMFLLVGCSSAHNSTQSGGNSGVNVQINPTSATVVVGQTATFQASVSGTTNTGVTWEVEGVVGGNTTVGTISAGGLYTAPSQVPNPAVVSITAISQANAASSGSATARVVAANSNQQRQNIPIELGTSGGNANDIGPKYCCGGTLGSLLEDNAGNFYILSNNHVLGRSDLANPGEPIIQPGLIDANCSTVATTIVGSFTFAPSLETPSTNVDAAIAKIVAGTVDVSGSILLLGPTASGGTSDPGPPRAGGGITATIGKAVAKSGRTSGLTCSTVDAIAVTTSVNYQKGCQTGTTFNKTFTGQVSVSSGSFSAAGDSGSLIVDQNTADPVALLYGGSDANSVGSPIADVLNALQANLGSRPTFVGGAAHKVAGCTLPAGAAAPQAKAQAVTGFSSAQLAQAQRARDIHAPELLANAYIQAIGVGSSIDHPGEPAVVLVVDPNQIPVAVPGELEGVPTRIVRATESSPHGIFDMASSASIAPVVDTFSVNTVSDEQLSRAKIVHAAHVDELMQQPGVQGVGITSSADAPGEAALMIFVVRGVPRNPVPATIDGLRTRVRESSRFTAGQRGNETIAGCKVPPAKAVSAATLQRGSPRGEQTPRQ